MLMTPELVRHKTGMASTPHILVVEDDREISALVARYLQANECRVSVADDGRAMDRVLAESRIDLIVLDLMLPGEDGLSLCRRLRAASAVPIVMLTAKSEEIDRIIGLEMGADDYLPKPFNPRELLARIWAVLRRSEDGGRPIGEADTSLILHFDGWQLDLGARRLTAPDGNEVDLSAGEFDLLAALAQRPRRV